MNRSIFRIALLCFALTTIQTEEVWAWGNEGHKIVCGIALKLLTPEEQNEVDRLTRLYRQPDGQKYQYFTEACTFADRARNQARNNATGWSYFNRFNRWHFLNVPRETQTVNESHCGSDCVLKGIEYHSARLANHDLPEWKRAEALFFIGHWIGDIHQPLHVSFADDLGGNEIEPIQGGYYTPSHLHYIWDSGILRKAIGSGGWWAYAESLKNRITPTLRAQWSAASPLEWAQESYELTITPEVDYCEWVDTDEGGLCKPEGHVRHFGASYQQNFQDDIEMRLQQAGVRLAERIRLGLGL
jgi:hypothetical protein